MDIYTCIYIYLHSLSQWTMFDFLPRAREFYRPFMCVYVCVIKLHILEREKDIWHIITDCNCVNAALRNGNAHICYYYIYIYIIYNSIFMKRYHRELF